MRRGDEVGHEPCALRGDGVRHEPFALEQVARGYDATFGSPLEKPSLSAWETYANQLAKNKKLDAFPGRT